MQGTSALFARVRALFIGAGIVAVAVGALTFLTARPPSPIAYDKTSMRIVCAQAVSVVDASGEHKVIQFSNFAPSCQNGFGAGSYTVQLDLFQPNPPADPHAYLDEVTLWTPKGQRFEVAAFELGDTTYATDAYAHPAGDTPLLQSNRMVGEIIAGAGVAVFLLSLLSYLVLRRK